MSINVLKNTKIFIACPANIVTGGPELLHQLAYHLINDLNVPSYMLYYNFKKNKFNSPVPKEYEKYNVPYVLDIPKNEDKDDNILIVPEIFSALLLLPKYNNIRKGVWFLSVDNYYFSRLKKLDLFDKKIINKILKILGRPPLFELYTENILKKLKKKYDYIKDPLLKLANFYMSNTYRGLEWFNKLKPLYYLSEYISDDFFKIEVNISKKENIVAYNPAKGISFTRKLIKYAPDIKFVPLYNMSRKEVIETLKKAKVYIDFGNHPGKDRLPREAAILGCCVITGKRGSAGYFSDVPIPEEYKFEDKEENIPRIIEKIRDCFKNFERIYVDFNSYREIIKKEKIKFINDLKNIFIKKEKHICKKQG